MFSGLTNQVSSWMGAAKGEPQDEEVPTPTKEAGDGTAATETDKAQSPTKAGGKLDMLTNVKSQVSGWLGSGIAIPGLRKGEAPAEGVDPGAQPEPAPLEKAPEGEPTKDDDDNSSATGGADSRPASGPGTPTDEQAGGVGNDSTKSFLKKVENSEIIPEIQIMTHKAVAGAKSIGSFLYSAVNKAGAKVSEASAKIKKTVEENSILGEFNREQDAFIKGQKGRGAAVPPWSGHPNEQELKEECLLLSTDLQNFVREPPVDFEFNYDNSYPIATAIMDEDPNLQKMRFELVPKVITEENFWRNYFYRVSLICRANEPDASGEGLDQPDAEARLSPDVDPENSDKSKDPTKATRTVEPTVNKKEIDNVKNRIKSLKVEEGNKNEEEWEKELEAELRDYEVVGGDKNAAPSDDKQWENECEELLGDTDDDLK